MHWVIHASVFSERNLTRLVQTLDRADLPYTLVSIDSQGQPNPEVDQSGPVYVCGAWRAAELAERRFWAPGSFLNENFEVGVWSQHLSAELLNEEIELGRAGDIELRTSMFVRPAADTKSFDGQVFTPAEWNALREQNPGVAELEVSVSPVRSIFREYRLFVIEGRVVTGSLYRRAGEVVLSGDVDPEAIEYAEGVVRRWSPAKAFVVDVALTEDGYRLIEFNNINSSGFYESNVARYVDGIERAFGDE